ncbi:SDR family oxidoreductase [Microcystis aeruginosa BLCCF158]|uniref:SDR family oxidoreductase n=1 Tax=Microcystis aeruginosa BLCC-F158 TaxID=2755316 RepID=A0A841USJ3_MICAE|nr:SDR family oxidoreductase [Microcystis aeruginosa]MBC1193971.1 SDR family oxidoreductase [Microcystis aeruginosa BLCC-F158]
MQKTALITGASGGIGRALCAVFQAANYRVIGLDKVKSEDRDHLEGDLRQMCLSQSYRSEVIEQIREFLKQSHGLDVLINNAAVQIVKPMDEITLEDWYQTLDINLIAPFLLAQELLPELQAASGSVINIASIHATLTKLGFICYATSKAALVGLTKSMAVELGAKVRVNAICPAAVATPMLLAGFEGKEGLFKELSDMHPVGRIAEPEEVAKAALFLASQDAQFINGASLQLDGGISSRLHDPV